MNRSLKSGIAAGLDGLGILAALRNLRAPNSGIILTFHRILARQDMALCYDPHILMCADTFDALLALLTMEFDVVPLDDLLSRPGSERRRQRVALTFDDGWVDTCTVAFPLLRKYNLPASVFLCPGLMSQPGPAGRIPEERFADIWTAWEERGETGSLERLLAGRLGRQSKVAGRSGWSQELKMVPMTDRCRLLSELEQRCGTRAETTRSLMVWPEAAAMMAGGITFGSHTMRHCTLTSETDETVQHELAQSRQEIEVRTGKPVRTLAYPNGAHSDRVGAIAKQAGYENALAVGGGLVTAGSNPWSVPRLSMDDFVVAGADGRWNASRARLYLQGLR